MQKSTRTLYNSAKNVLPKYRRSASQLFSFASTLTLFSVILGIKWVLLIYFLYYILMCKRIYLHYQKTEENKQIVSKLKGLEKVFYPHILWLLPQVQTIAYMVRKKPINHYKEIEIVQDDGGSFYMHIYEPEENTNKLIDPKHTVILVHGLGGSAHSKHVTILAEHFTLAGHRVACVAARGTMHRLKTPIFFHIGWTKDLISAAKYLLSTYSGTISGVGFSLGGHWMAKMFGELDLVFTEQEQKRILGGMAISIPFDFVKISEYMKKPIPKRIYNRTFAGKIHKFVRKNKEVFIKHKYPVDQILKAQTMHEIDLLLTLRVFNILDIDEYYHKESCVQVISRIKKPFFILNSKDDPIVPYNTIPIKECLKSTHVILGLTERGGHMGFMGYCNYLTYAEEAALEFTDALLHLK